MRTNLTLVAAAVTLVAADAPKPEAAKAHLARLQGTWRLVSLEANGQKVPDKEIKDVIRTINGDKYEVTRGGKPAGKGSLTLDPTTSPKAMDAESTIRGQDGSTKTAKILGIYELDDDTLKTCFADPGKDRPTAFATKAGSGHRLFVWKREKK